MVRFRFIEDGIFIYIEDTKTGKRYDINFDIIDIVDLMNEIDGDFKCKLIVQKSLQDFIVNQGNEIKYLKSSLDYDLARIEKQSEIIKDFLNENVKLRHKIGELQFRLSQIDGDYELGDDYYG